MIPTPAPFRRLLKDRRGGTAIEYTMIAVLITIGLIAAMQFWGESAAGMYETLAETGWGDGEEPET
jgi:Flp pilus assembly pilin Flp